MHEFMKCCWSSNGIVRYHRKRRTTRPVRTAKSPMINTSSHRGDDVDVTRVWRWLRESHALASWPCTGVGGPCVLSTWWSVLPDLASLCCCASRDSTGISVVSIESLAERGCTLASLSSPTLVSLSVDSSFTTSCGLAILLSAYANENWGISPAFVSAVWCVLVPVSGISGNSSILHISQVVHVHDLELEKTVIMRRGGNKGTFVDIMIRTKALTNELASYALQVHSLCLL